MSRVCIIGMGWLGLQMARKLKAEGHEVLGTVSSKEKQQNLKNEFEAVFDFNINEFKESQVLQFDDIDYFILTIPPSASDNYAERMKGFISELLNIAPGSKLVYTSSTSVYGSKPRMVTEESKVAPETKNAEEIVKIEQHLLHQFNKRSIVLRLAGLVGGDRHPAKYLSGRSNLKKGNAPVNLVHAEDICALVTYLIQQAISSGVYNVCSPEHPSKREYYTWAAKQFQLPLPNFSLLDAQKDKIVSCSAIKKINFEMNYKSPYNFPIINSHE